LAKADRCKTPEQVLTYGSPLAKRVRSNPVMQQSIKKLVYEERPRAIDKTGWSYSYTRPSPDYPPGGYTPAREYVGGAVNAFYEYTFAGPVEFMAAKSATQAGLLTAAGTYSTIKTGLAIELGLDFALIGAVLTATDPGNKWEGGLDEWGFYGGNSGESLPGTMSGEEPTPFAWGLKQGHLGQFWSAFFGV